MKCRFAKAPRSMDRREASAFRAFVTRHSGSILILAHMTERGRPPMAALVPSCPFSGPQGGYIAAGRTRRVEYIPARMTEVIVTVMNPPVSIFGSMWLIRKLYVSSSPPARAFDASSVRT